MPIFPTTSIQSIQSLEKTLQNIESTANYIDKTVEFIQVYLLRKLDLEYDKGLKLVNVLIGSTLSATSIIKLTYAQSLTSKIFFFLSCVSGSVGTITSAQSLYNQY